MKKKPASWELLHPARSTDDPPPTTTAVTQGSGAYMWGGRFHIVPEHFEFPSGILVRPLFELWYEGNGGLNHGKYKDLA